MRSRFIGGILLIVGTSIGGGMLALPVANGATGFWLSSIFLIICWMIMTLGAFFILEVNLYLPPGKNMVSMAYATLGAPGLVLAWLSYLFLLYILLSGYISGGADVLSGLLKLADVHANQSILVILFTVLFGFVVYGGIRQVDLLNRGLMFLKLGAYCILLLAIAPFTRVENFQGGDVSNINGTIMILITSYGFAIIVPNLREYFNDDIKTLKKVIFIGSLIPLFCYLAWDAIIIGSLNSPGTTNLSALMQDEHTTSSLARLLSNMVQNPLISSLFNFFTSICMLTAFLGVALCLISFLGDGLNLVKKGKQGFTLLVLTFLPPLILVIYYPGAYIHALNYAGYFCVILLLFMPALMSFFGRKKYKPEYTVSGGKTCQIGIMISALLLFYLALQ